MFEEKIFFKEGDVTVTASRVVIGEKNFVLRNISTVKVETTKTTNIENLIYRR